MRRAARACDDDAQTAIRRYAREISGRIRGAMRGKNARLIRYAKSVERFDGMAHRFPIGSAAHDDGHERGGRFFLRHLSVHHFPRSTDFASRKHALLFLMTGRGRAIVLIGFMGSGKSATGRALARKTGRPLSDTDEIVSG